MRAHLHADARSPRSARSSPRSTPRRSSSASADGIPTRDYGVPAVEVLDAVADAEPPDDELERLRILARTPRWGREIDEGDPARRGGARRASVSFTKGCFPGQEPRRPPAAPRPREPHAARRSRWRASARARRAEVRRGDDVVGRVTSAVPGLALAYVRAEVPEGAELTVAGRPRPDTLTPRARSSGDRALPCGGRGRKFESCRAHFLAARARAARPRGRRPRRAT